MTDRRVMAVRAVVLWSMRGLAAILAAWGLLGIGNRLAFGLLNGGGMRQAWEVWMGIGEDHGLFRGLPLLAIGIALGLASRPLARWMIRPPETGCPACGHGEAATAPRCTECGRPASGDARAGGTAGPGQ